MYQWHAAMLDISWDDAQMRIGLMSLNAEHDLRMIHKKYLEHPQFDKFRS